MHTIDTLRERWREQLDEAGLPGPALGFDRVRQALLLCQREVLAPTMMAIHWTDVSVDIEPSVVQLLVAQRIDESVRTYDTVFLLGDYVAVLLPDAREESARIVASRLMQQLRKPYQHGLGEVTLVPCGGVSVASPGDDCPGVMELWSDAVLAMEHARTNGGDFAAGPSDSSQELLQSME